MIYPFQKLLELEFIFVVCMFVESTTSFGMLIQKFGEKHDFSDQNDVYDDEKARKSTIDIVQLGSWKSTSKLGIITVDTQQKDIRVTGLKSSKQLVKVG